MSTRGAIGFIFNNEEKIGYNHFDSYPTGLGNDILNFLYKKNNNQLKDIFSKIILDKNSENNIWDNENNCFNFSFRDCKRFLWDSLFCEWAYIINLDSNKLEIYRGFNKNENAAGRYAHFHVEDSSYYGVVLINEIGLNQLFDNKCEFDENDNGNLK